MKIWRLWLLAGFTLIVFGCGKEKEPETSKPEEGTAKEEAVETETSIVAGAATTLNEAAAKGDLAQVKKLLQKGANVNAKDAFSATPLHEAAEAGHKAVAQLLVSKGANVNAKAQDKSTPLHLAAAGYHKDIAELLIVKGADVNAKDGSGNTPLHLAVEWSGDASLPPAQKAVVELLLSKGADPKAQNNIQQDPGLKALHTDELFKLIQKYSSK